MAIMDEDEIFEDDVFNGDGDVIESETEVTAVNETEAPDFDDESLDDASETTETAEAAEATGEELSDEALNGDELSDNAGEAPDNDKAEPAESESQTSEADLLEYNGPDYDWGASPDVDYDPDTESNDENWLEAELKITQPTTQEAKTSFITLLIEMVKDAIKSMRDRHTVNRVVNQAAKMAESGEDVDSDVELDDVTKLKIDILAEKMFLKYAGTSEGETASGERFFKSMAETTAKLAGGELTDDALEKTAERFMKTSAGKELGKYIEKHGDIKSEVLQEVKELAERLSKCDSVESVVNAAVNDLDIGAKAIKIGLSYDKELMPDLSLALLGDKIGYNDVKELHEVHGLKFAIIDGQDWDLEWTIDSFEKVAKRTGLAVGRHALNWGTYDGGGSGFQLPKTDGDQIIINLGSESVLIGSDFFDNVESGQTVIFHCKGDCNVIMANQIESNLENHDFSKWWSNNFAVVVTNDFERVYDNDLGCYVEVDNPTHGTVIEVINGQAERREETQDEFAARLAKERPEEYRDFLADTRQSTAGWSQEELADYLGEDWEGFEEDRAEAIAEANRIEAIAEAEAEVESKPIIIFPDDEAEHVPAPEASSDSTAEAETVVETNEAVDDAVPAADATPVEPAANEAVADEQGDGLSDAVVGLLDHDVPVEAANDALVTDEAVTEAVAPAVLDEPAPEASEAPTETVGGTDVFADSAAEPAVDSAAEAANDKPTVEVVDNTPAENVTVSTAEENESAEQATGLSGAGAVSANEASNDADQAKDDAQKAAGSHKKSYNKNRNKSRKSQ